MTRGRKKPVKSDMTNLVKNDNIVESQADSEEKPVTKPTRGRRDATNNDKGKPAVRDLRKFAGKKQRTDFSFLKTMFPKSFADKYFRLVVDDEGGANLWEMADRGWETVSITPEMAATRPELKRFMNGKESGEGGIIRVPVNKTHPELGLYGILMMKDADAFEVEERAALNQEVRRTEVGLKAGRDQAETGANEDVFYAPKVGLKDTGFKVTQKESLI